MKILTSDGIVDDRIREENLDTKPRDSQKVQESEQKSKKEIYKEFNNNPKTRSFGAIAISKKSYYLLWISIFTLILLFGINVFWSNISKEDVVVNNTIVNEMNPPDTNIYNNFTDDNQFTINNQMNMTPEININVGDELADRIADEVLDIINKSINGTL